MHDWLLSRKNISELDHDTNSSFINILYDSIFLLKSLVISNKTELAAAKKTETAARSGDTIETPLGANTSGKSSTIRKNL